MILPFPQRTSESSEGPHLTGDQMSDLLTSASTGEAQAHLDACPACAQELSGLREALSLFHVATVNHAEREMQNLHQSFLPIIPTRRSHSQSYLWVAAGIALIAGIFPLQMRWQQDSPVKPAVAHVVPAHTQESDEALLADIDRELDASVPASMQQLADPTSDTTSPSNASTQRNKE